jgi:TP901 family phage tail tape measure protein
MANTEKIVVQVVVQGEKDLQRVGKSADKSTKSFGKMAAGIVSAGAAFNAINKAIGSAITTFKNFEFSMAKVKAITGASEKDFKKLTNTAQQLGRSTFFTASQVSELQVAYGKLGFTTTEILDAQEATLMLATATQSDLARAAVVAGAAVRGFALDASETQRVVDVMAVSFTSSALDIEKFQTSMTKVAPIASAAGISIETTTAIMGTLTDAGIEASIAGTSLRNIFLKMQDPASDLTKKLGFTVDSSADLERALTKLNDEGLSNAEMMELVDIRQVAAFTTMINGTDNVLNLTDALEDANGKAQEMADIMADTLEGDILKAKSAWEGLEISILTGGNNISRSLRSVVSDWTEFISTIVDNMRTPEQLGADFLTDALNRIKDTQKEIDDLQKSGAPVETKTRVELLQEESEKLERVQGLQKQALEFATKEGEGFGFRAKAARDYAEDLTKQIEAREFALNDLEEIIDLEVKKEKNKNDRVQLDKDIAIEKARRAKEKENKEKLKEKEKAEKEELALEKKEFQEKKNAIKIESQELENTHKELLINEQITQETYDLMAFEAEQAHLENMKNLNIAYGEDVSSINGQILDNELKMIAEKAAAEKTAFDKKVAEDAQEKKDREDKIGEMQDIGNQLIFIAGEEKNLQGVKQAGIQISRAAAIATSFEAMADYGKAIASAAADSPWYLKIINVVGLIASMASTLSLIKSMKSSFGDGGVIETFANGGMVHGKSHAQGGEKFAVGGRVVELEGGEAVINKRSTAMFGKQLSAMNAAGGGVKFADGGLLNMPSFSQQQFNAIGQNQMMGAMGSSSKVVVVEADITDSQNLVSVIQSEATI